MTSIKPIDISCFGSDLLNILLKLRRLLKALRRNLMVGAMRRSGENADRLGCVVAVANGKAPAPISG